MLILLRKPIKKKNMKRSDTLFRHKAKLLYDTCSSIREMVNATTSKLYSGKIEFEVYEKLGVCERVGTWVNVEGKEGRWELITAIYPSGMKNIMIETELYGGVEDMYEYSLDTLIYLHDELEKIYKFVVKGK